VIVITTPTGQIGRHVLGNLLDSGEQLFHGRCPSVTDDSRRAA